MGKGAEVEVRVGGVWRRRGGQLPSPAGAYGLHELLLFFGGMPRERTWRDSCGGSSG